MENIGASLMVADLLNIEREIKELEYAGIDYYHVDIMDGNFVNNFALSPDFIKAIRPLTPRTIDVHLMVQDPERYIDIVSESGADIITVHAEATPHLQRVLNHIKKRGKKAGVALNPATPIIVLEHIIDVLDLVLIMTVNPGFAGQEFIPSMYEKILSCRQWLDSKRPGILLQVDGHINAESIPLCHKNGADLYVVGTSALFKQTGTLAGNLMEIRKLLRHSICRS